MGLLDRIAAAQGRDEKRFAIDSWIADYLLPANQFGYNGVTYPFGFNQTLAGDRTREFSNTLPGYMAALRYSPPAFAAQMVRALVLSQARFAFRGRSWSRNPGRTFGTTALALLEQPWPNGTTGELLSRMEWHAGLAGNAYVARTQDRLRVLRPDWTVIVYGSQREPEDPAHALDGEILGYAYCNGGFSERRNKVETLLPADVAHWSPLPDPEHAGIGMSWITPAIREIQGDQAATTHKLRFFENGATPNMVVKGITAATKDQFDEIVDAMETRHAGVRNAYRTLYLAAGADATVVGADLRQIDFKATQGAGETRIAMLSRVHPVILGASEGLAGSSLNAGNFAAARRAWADSWIYPTLQDVAAALAPLVRVPADAELWPVTTDMPILREDAKDAAEIESTKASTIVSLSTGGFTRKSAVAAVMAQDMTLLQEDPNWVSVQLQQSGGTAPAPSAGGAGPKVPPVAGRAYNPAEPREPHSGQWTDGGAAVDAAKDVLKLAERIQLDKDEHFVSSDRISPKGGTDVDTLFAVVDSPRGREIRIGIIPVDDAEKWRAGNRGGTVKLTPSGVAQLHTDLTEANAKAKKTAAKVEAQYAAGDDPPVSLWDNAVAEGTVSGEWGDLAYRVYLTDDEPTSWTTTLEVQPSTGGDGSTFYPKDLRKLIGKLAELS